MGRLGALSPGGSIAIGVFVGLISTSLQAIGLTLQRKSHLLEDEKRPYDLRRPPYKRRRWQLGMLMFVVSNIVGSTIQITTLPLPVLSTLQASGLVFNTIFAALILREPFTRCSIFGTILVCLGAILIGTFGAIGEPAHTLNQLLVLLGRPPFLVWMAGTTGVVVLTILAARLLKLVSTPGRTREWMIQHCITIPCTPSFYGHNSPRIKMMRGMMYGFVSGILSAHSLLVAKSAVELIVRTIIDRVNQFNRWQSWIILLGLIALALTQLYYMHSGLKLCSTSVLYPYVFCIYNVIAILDGLIYFDQGSRLSGLYAGLIALGTIILLSGVLCLSWRLEDATAHPNAVPAGPTPTPLASGLGPLEEQLTPPEYIYYPEDEETALGERQPLLQQPQQQQQQQQRKRKPSPPPLFYTRSLSHLPLRLRRSTQPSLETAEIWADLDDSGETLDPDLAAPTSPLLPFTSFPHRHYRSKSSTIPSLSYYNNNNSNSSSRKRSIGVSDCSENNSPLTNDPSSPSSPRLTLNNHHQQRQIRRLPRASSWTWDLSSRRVRFAGRGSLRSSNGGDQCTPSRRRMSSPFTRNYRCGAVQRDVCSAATAGAVGGVDDAGTCTNANARARARDLGDVGVDHDEGDHRPQHRSQFTGPLRWLGQWVGFRRRETEEGGNGRMKDSDDDGDGDGGRERDR
ncbi:hypothetical protein PABG_06503 [Paracoccidioides brasiliensis Pb03]|nr:hypothetical protein PABG_06503 [Paracoccidioides brasiliensis Pb03]